MIMIMIMIMIYQNSFFLIKQKWASTLPGHFPSKQLNKPALMSFLNVKYELL